MSAMTSVLSSDEQPRKKMRKGTHSCTECRRRKKSCIPHPSSSNICTECFARGSRCQDQQATSITKRPSPDSKQSLQQRVAELEAALQSIATKLDGSSGPQDTENDAARTLTQLRAEIVPPNAALSTSPGSPSETRLDNAPVLSLFDNSILSRFQDDDDNDEGSDTTRRHDAHGTSPKLDHIRDTLLALFPPQAKIDAILDASQSWWHITQTLFPQIYGVDLGTHIKHFIAESRTSNNVQKIAKALLCISGCLQEAPEISSILNLDLGRAMTAPDLVAHYLNVIHDLVTSDDELVGTIDGVECLFLQCKHEINDGRIRRGWITVHRALSFSQLLGLHTWPKSPKPSETASLRRQSLWVALYQCDRFLSLLLGLPYAVAEMPSSRLGNQTNNGPTLTGERYLVSLSNIIGHIIDRNSEPPSNNTLPSTIKIEGEMTDLAALMPNEWWVNDTKEDAVKEQIYSRLIPQFWHYQARTLLHLPFMLKAATDRRYEYNKIAALESAREMLQRYRLFRPAQGFNSTVCKVVDFQVFTAAMVLVLNLLSLSQSSTVRDQQEAAMDEELICTTHDLLHRASCETEAGVTTQATKALKMFCKARADPCPVGQKSAKIVIPYFGTVVFGPGKDFSNQAYLKHPVATPAQLPTPEMESLDPSLQAPSSLDSLYTIPADFHFSGFQLQEPSNVDMNAGLFANMNQDLDQDWSWFWNNTDWNQA